MKVKTAELSGAALDWMVWVCAGGAEAYPKLKGKTFLRAWRSNSSKYLNPSTEWAQGGPIIDRMGITPRRVLPFEGMWEADSANYKVRCEGPTALIAVCRCYVASEMGDEVDVPEELLS